jgi:hypothetical protein
MGEGMNSMSGWSKMVMVDVNKTVRTVHEQG